MPPKTTKKNKIESQSAAIKGKAPVPLAMPSLMLLSARDAVAREGGSASAGSDSGSEPMIVDAPARKSPAHDHQEPNKINNAAESSDLADGRHAPAVPGAQNTTTTTTTTTSDKKNKNKNQKNKNQKNTDDDNTTTKNNNNNNNNNNEAKPAPAGQPSLGVDEDLAAVLAASVATAAANAAVVATAREYRRLTSDVPGLANGGTALITAVSAAVGTAAAEAVEEVYRRQAAKGPGAAVADDADGIAFAAGFAASSVVHNNNNNNRDDDDDDDDNDDDDDDNDDDDINTPGDDAPPTTDKPDEPELFFDHWPLPSRPPSSRRPILELLRKLTQPMRAAPDDVPDHDLSDDQWRRREVAVDEAALARGMAAAAAAAGGGGGAAPGNRVPASSASTPFTMELEELRRRGDLSGLAQYVRSLYGPPSKTRSADDHRAYAAFMEVTPPLPGVVPGFGIARPGGPSMADRKRALHLARVRAQRDAAAKAEREAEEEEAAKAAEAAAAAAEDTSA